MTEQPPPCLPHSSGGRVAFFGGSFDPPHLGHLAVARAARDALRLDRVLFVPVGAQPLKPHGSTAPFADRVAMTSLAIAGEPAFEISLADAPASDNQPNYTLETLILLRDALPPAGSLFCLMGADSFVSLRRWRGAAEIPFVASLIVASRPGQQLDDLTPFLPPSLTLDLPTSSVILSEAERTGAESKDPQFGKPESAKIEVRCYHLRNPAGRTAPFYMLPNLDVEISASEIRDHIRSSSHADAATRALLPDSVTSYIRAHSLYR